MTTEITSRLTKSSARNFNRATGTSKALAAEVIATFPQVEDEYVFCMIDDEENYLLIEWEVGDGANYRLRRFIRELMDSDLEPTYFVISQGWSGRSVTQTFLSAKEAIDYLKTTIN